MKSTLSKMFATNRKALLPTVLMLALSFGGGPSAVAANSPAAHPDPLKVVVITGDHPFTEKTFIESFQGNADIQFVHAPQQNHDEIFEDVSNWDYDVMVCYHFSQLTPSPARQEGFKQLLNRGVGLVVLHHGTLTYPQWPESEQIFGRKRDVGGPFGYYVNQRYTVRLADPTHPILQGMTDFAVEDETYDRYYGEPRPDNHILLTTEHKPSETELAWTRSYAHARVFAFQLGHDTPVFTNANYKRILAQGIRWTSGRLPAKAGEPALAGGSRFRERNFEWALETLTTYQVGQRREPCVVIENRVQASLIDPAASAALAAQLAPLLSSPATRDAKSFVLRQLGQLRAAAQIPALAALLKDAELSHMARYALEPIATPEADAALRAALATTSGGLRIGVINSLGQRRDAKAVTALVAVANNAEAATTTAALEALGNIGNVDALRALQKLKVPTALDTARAWAVLDCAQHLALAGQGREAASAAQTYVEASHPALVRATALRVLMTATPDQALPRAVAALKGSDPDLRRAALAGLRDLPGKKAATAYADCLAALDATGKVQVLTALALRGDVSVRPPVEKCAGDADEAVRIAAMQTLASLGEAKSVPVLVKRLAAGSEAEKAVAIQTLERLPGVAVSEAILRQARLTEPAITARLVNVLGQRGATELFADIRKFATHTNPAVRDAAMASLGLLVESKSLPSLLSLLSEVPHSGDRAAVEKSLVAAVKRLREKEATLRVLTEAYPQALAADRPVVLHLIASLGTDPALDFLKAKALSTNLDVQRSAVQALAAWPDGRPFELLWSFATTATDAKMRAVAVEGCTTMLVLPDNSLAADKVARCIQLLKLAEIGETRIKLLELLQELPDLAALNAVLPLLANPSVAYAAATTTLEQASQLALEYPAEAKAALEKLSKDAPDGGLQRRARSALEKMEQTRKGLRAEWTFNDDAGSWVAANQCTIKLQDGALVVDSTGVDPFIQVKSTIPPGQYLVEVRMKSASTGPAQFFWTTDKSPGFGPLMLAFNPTQHDNQWHTYSLPLNLDGTLTELRFDPSCGTGTILVDFIRVMVAPPVSSPTQ